MKNLFLLSLLLLSTTLMAQKVDNCWDLSLEDKEQIAAAEPCALALSDFILSQPLKSRDNQETLRVLQSTQQLLAWMEKAPYTFALNPILVNLSSNIDSSLFGVYLASLSKAALEHGSEEIQKQALGYFIRYVEDKSKGVPRKRSIKKLLKDWKSGDYKAYL